MWGVDSLQSCVAKDRDYGGEAPLPRFLSCIGRPLTRTNCAQSHALPRELNRCRVVNKVNKKSRGSVSAVQHGFALFGFACLGVPRAWLRCACSLWTAPFRSLHSLSGVRPIPGLHPAVCSACRLQGVGATPGRCCLCGIFWSSSRLSSGSAVQCHRCFVALVQTY